MAFDVQKWVSFYTFLGAIKSQHFLAHKWWNTRVTNKGSNHASNYRSIWVDIATKSYGLFYSQLVKVYDLILRHGLIFEKKIVRKNESIFDQIRVVLDV